MNGSIINMKKSIIILCLLGDPILPAVSCDRSGGFNVDMTEILKYWSKSSNLITVITNSSSYAPQTDEQLYENIQIHRVFLEDDILNNQFQLKYVFPRVMEETLQFIESTHIHPLFFHSYYWYSGLLALHLSKKYNVPFLHSVVALAIDKKLTNSPNFCSVQYEFETTFLSFATYIMAISNAEKQTLIDYYNCKKENVIVVGRAVDDAFLLPDHDNKGISNLLLLDNERKWNSYLAENSSNDWWYYGAFTYIGRIKYEKGLGNIIESWYQLYYKYKDNMPPLWIVGGQPDTITPLRDDFVKRYPEFERLEKEMKICWWGYLTPASINAVLLKTSVVVTHSQYEAGGRVIIEALSAGKPVIATPTGFAADLIRDWKNGFLVSFDDIVLLKKRMEHFIKQPLITNPLGEYARISFQEASKHWYYYEKHRALYEYLSDNTCEKEFFYKEEKNIFEKIPDFFSKKLLYSWPDYHEVQNKIEFWLRKKEQKHISHLIYCPDLSHHSYIWKYEKTGHTYYVKHIYTTFTDIVLWNADTTYSYIFQAKDAYNISVCSDITLNIAEKDSILKLYITERQELVATDNLLTNYKEVLQTIFLFNYSSPANDSKIGMNTFTLEHLLQFVFDGICDNTFYNELSLLLKNNFAHLQMIFSYGKKFSSHVVLTDTGYKLLPSSSVCMLPLGMDAAIFLNELLDYFGNNLYPEKFNQLLLDAAEIFHISAYTMLRLCILIRLLIMKKQYQLFNKPITEEDITFWRDLLFIFKTANFQALSMENDNV